jgi:hypothetical protein
MPAEDPKAVIGAINFFARRVSYKLAKAPIDAHLFLDGHALYLFSKPVGSVIKFDNFAGEDWC